METRQGHGSLLVHGKAVPVTYTLQLGEGGATGTLEMSDGGLSLLTAPPVCALTLEGGKQLNVNVQRQGNVIVVRSSGPVKL